MLPEAAAYKKNWQKAQRARLKDGCENDCYVYLHLNEDDDLPHHVGMGHTVDRPWSMARNPKHKNKVKKHGVRVELIADELTEEVSLWWEVRWIKALKAAGYELTNLTDGGEGVVNLSEESKARKSAALKLANLNPEIKSAKSERVKGDKNPSKKPGVGAKISAAQKALGENHHSKKPEAKEQRRKNWLGDLNPNKKPENKKKISVRMTENNPFFDPKVLEKRSGENHHSKKEGWVSPNLGKPNLKAKARMLDDNPMKSPDVARKANDKRKENGNGWEGDKNPSKKMTKEQLIERGKKTAETRRRNKLLKERIA